MTRIVRELAGACAKPTGARERSWDGMDLPDALDGRLTRFSVPTGLLRAFPTAVALVRQRMDKRRQSWRKYPTRHSIDPELTPGLDTETDDGLRKQEAWYVVYEE